MSVAELKHALSVIKALCVGDAPEHGWAQHLQTTRNRMRIADICGEALTKLPAAWQPIETAPKSETNIIVCTPEGLVGEAKFYDEAERWYWAGSDPSDYHDGSIDVVAYWMPLPVPPDSTLSRPKSTE